LEGWSFTIKLCPQGMNGRKIVPWSGRMASRFFGDPTGRLKALKKLSVGSGQLSVELGGLDVGLRFGYATMSSTRFSANCQLPTDNCRKNCQACFDVGL
jgi:hypothetical protein